MLYKKTHVSIQFWTPIQDIVESLTRKYAHCSHVLKLGPGERPFSLTSHAIEMPQSTIFHSKPTTAYTLTHLDLDREIMDLMANSYHFGYARHIFEDLQNPDFVFEQFTAICKEGYIETPSPLVECLKGAESPDYRGYAHHRYIVWTEKEDNSLHFLPKFPIIEHIYLKPETEQNWINIAESSPYSWNNYYTWDIADRKPKCKIYKHGCDFEIFKDYAAILNHAILKSIEHTQSFILNLRSF